MLLNIGIIIVSPLNPLFPFFLHHHCLQILYTTNFLRENVFYILYDFFLVMFPTQKLRDFASWTSLTIVDAGQMAITPQELLKVIGLLYGMTVQQHGERRSYWRVENEGEESLFPAPAWGTWFGMGQRRFETRYLTLRDPTCVDEGDRWHPVHAFKEWRLDKIHPSGSLVVDESFGSWVSQKPDYMPDELPNTQKIMRKPKGVGTEFKNLADGVTGVMMRLEIQEKKADMADKDWSALPASTAWLFRLCELYFGSHRIIRADSAITSTTAAVELGKRGMFLQGIVKGAKKEYPAKYLDTLQYEKGDHHVATSTIEGIPMLALGWQDRTLKKFLATCATTIEGHPHKKKMIPCISEGCNKGISCQVP